MSALAPVTFVAFLASAVLGSEPPTQDVKEELREAGKHVGNAARTVVDRTKEGVRTAVDRTKEGVGTAADRTKKAVGTAADRTKEGVGTAAEKVRSTGTKTGHKRSEE